MYFSLHIDDGRLSIEHHHEYPVDMDIVIGAGQLKFKNMKAYVRQFIGTIFSEATVPAMKVDSETHAIIVKGEKSIDMAIELSGDIYELGVVQPNSPIGRIHAYASPRMASPA